MFGLNGAENEEDDEDDNKKRVLALLLLLVISGVLLTIPFISSGSTGDLTVEVLDIPAGQEWSAEITVDGETRSIPIAPGQGTVDIIEVFEDLDTGENYTIGVNVSNSNGEVQSASREILLTGDRTETFEFPFNGSQPPLNPDEI